MLFIPVVSKIGNTLMPCHSARAKMLIRKGKAVKRFKRGIFYIQLTERKDGAVQEVACGIDPGSKKEGFTVKSANHTFLNIQSNAKTGVGEKLEERRIMRRSRRNRNTPCRKNKQNRNINSKKIPAGTKARWDIKLKIVKILKSLFPISSFVVEDIKATTKKNQKRWNSSFSPLEVGKTWFYKEIEKLGNITIKQGYETYQERNNLQLKKDKNKLSDKFEAHCVDSWVLANMAVGGHIKPDNTSMLIISPIELQRRQLHRLQAEVGGERKRYGSTNSLGFKRGGLVKHIKYGLCYVGGFIKNRISLHNLETGKRVCQNSKISDCIKFGYNTWKLKYSY